jgi:hypothetical protein
MAAGFAAPGDQVIRRKGLRAAGRCQRWGDDAQELLARGEHPWTFLAFPPNIVNEDGVPADAEAQEYIGAVQSEGVPVGVWVNTPTTDAYAFVGPAHVHALHDVLKLFRESGRFPGDYAKKLSDRLLGNE